MKPLLLQTIAEFRRWRETAGPVVPFVPTMGALHEGHASLVRAAGAIGGRVAVSIFVNPTQFGPQEDFSRYPRTLEADLTLLEQAGAEVVFAPSPAEMYRPEATITVDPGPLGQILEGAIRPGHFRGVCTVVLKLLHIVAPSHLLMGQKDYQQQAILRQMIGDLDLPVTLVTCPTIREADGLAMSSRNRYLNAAERRQGVALYEALAWARDVYAGGERSGPTISAEMSRRIAAGGLDVQYAQACHAQTLAPWNSAIAGPCVLLVAARLGATRLIDNMVV